MTDRPIGITGDDLRKSILWITEQMEGWIDTPLCRACGHGLRHHLSDRSLQTCTFPKALGAPKALCGCLDFDPGSGDDDEGSRTDA